MRAGRRAEDIHRDRDRELDLDPDPDPDCDRDPDRDRAPLLSPPVLREEWRMPSCVWHVTVEGEPACTAPAVTADDRIDPPLCGTRNRARAEEYAALLRARHPALRIAVVEHGCPMRGE